MVYTQPEEHTGRETAHIHNCHKVTNNNLYSCSLLPGFVWERCSLYSKAPAIVKAAKQTQLYFQYPFCLNLNHLNALRWEGGSQKLETSQFLLLMTATFVLTDKNETAGLSSCRSLSEANLTQICNVPSGFCKVASVLHFISFFFLYFCSWRLTTGMSWPATSCTRRSIPSSMHTNRPLPNPKALLGRGVAAASPDHPQKAKRKTKQTSATPLPHPFHSGTFRVMGQIIFDTFV